MGVDIGHYFVNPDLFELLLVVVVGSLVHGVAIRHTVLAEDFRIPTAGVRVKAVKGGALCSLEFLFQHAIVKVLHPLVARLAVVGLQIKSAVRCDDRHTNVVQFFGQIVPFEDVSR